MYITNMMTFKEGSIMNKISDTKDNSRKVEKK